MKGLADFGAVVAAGPAPPSCRSPRRLRASHLARWREYPLEHLGHGRVEPAVDLACAPASLLMPESQFDQVQGRDQLTRTFRNSQRLEGGVAASRRELRRLRERAFPSDERDRVIEVQRVKAERDVWCAALPVPCVQAVAAPAKIPWHQVAVPGAERQRDVPMSRFDTLSGPFKGRPDGRIGYAFDS